jgi:hypothetical protein
VKGFPVDSIFGSSILSSLDTTLILVLQMLYLLLAQTAGIIVECGIIYDPLIFQYGEWVPRPTLSEL